LPGRKASVINYLGPIAHRKYFILLDLRPNICKQRTYTGSPK
jgi:hypothetical protein